WPQWPRVTSTTWSPGFTLVTLDPTSSTTPAPSWPITRGGGKGLVPSMTLTSLWPTPAASMRTRTSLPPGARASRSSVTSILPFQTTPLTLAPFDCSCLARPDDALQLAVGVQPEVTAVAAHAAHLETAEGRLQVA